MWVGKFNYIFVLMLYVIKKLLTVKNMTSLIVFPLSPLLERLSFSLKN